MASIPCTLFNLCKYQPHSPVAYASVTHPEHVQEAPILHQLWVDVKELRHANGSRLTYIRVIILAATTSTQKELRVVCVHSLCHAVFKNASG